MKTIEAIRQHLKTNGTINNFEAIALYSEYHLAGRIRDLRRQGFQIINITKNNILTGNRYTDYKLEI